MLTLRPLTKVPLVDCKSIKKNDASSSLISAWFLLTSASTSCIVDSLERPKRKVSSLIIMRSPFSLTREPGGIPFGFSWKALCISNAPVFMEDLGKISTFSVPWKWQLSSAA